MGSRSPASLQRLPLSLAALIAALACILGCAQGSVIEPPEPRCGDGIKDKGEACDDGLGNSDEAPDACRSDCRLPVCGDGVQDAGEQCDDGNLEVGDGCDSGCAREYVCGDGVCEVQKGEGCSVCAQDCCVCGDGVCDAAQGETCRFCHSECCPDCGNGAVEPGEQCDDGNYADNDGCAVDCVDEDGTPTCGNGVLEGSEACDDGNLTAFDGCSPACQVEFTCGDGACETATGETCQLCQEDCCPNCGNGALDAGEECDGANLDGLTCTGACYDGGSLACTPWCVYDWSGCTGDLPTCGDGVMECGEACDGGDFGGATCGSLGYAGGSLTCTSSCAVETTDCDAQVLFLNETFDNACPPAGWTLSGIWQCGTPTGPGPGAAFTAPSCLGTTITGNYPASQSFATTTVTTPPINLISAVQPTLNMRAWVYTEGSSYDGYNLKVSTNGGATWSIVSAVSPAYTLTIGGESAWGGDQSALGWQAISANLSAYVGQTIQLRLAFQSDGSIQYPGVYIDNFSVSEPSAVPLAITTSTLPLATVNQMYQQTLAKTGGSAGSAWSIVSGTNHGWLMIDPATGVLSGTPTSANLGPVTVTVRVEEPAVPSNFAEKTFTFTVEQLIYATSFEGACPAGWALVPEWECGVPSNGPSAAYDGTQCIGTKLNANYSNSLPWTTTATSPTIAVPAGSSPTLTFRMWVSTEGSTYDGANLKISANGGAFQIVNSVTPAYNLTVGGESAWGGDMSASGWQLVTTSLAAYAGQNIQLRLAFRSDSSITYPGVFIDYVRIQ